MFYTLLMPRLHKRLAAGAMYHVHISMLIRSLEPHLSINQKLQLIRERSYDGQRTDMYSTQLDWNARPCASCVRELIIGPAAPGRHHEYVVHRYLEDALSNFHNLEVVDADWLTL
jgi:hypothetical protein